MNWDFADAQLHGLAFQKKIYSEINMAALTRNVLSKVEEISEETLLATAGAIPLEWFAPGDHECLRTLLRELQNRQLALPLLIERHRRHPGL